MIYGRGHISVHAVGWYSCFKSPTVKPSRRYKKNSVSYRNAKSLVMSNSEDQNDLLKQFVEISGLDPSRSRLYLESAGWNLDLALSSFYEEADENEMDLSTANEAADSDPSAPPPAESKGDSSKEPKKNSSGASGNSNRIMTFSSLTKDEPNEEEDGQTFYAGGSERSGQQILGPGKKKTNDIVSEMFKAAMEHGAEILDKDSCSSGKSKSFVFKGAGYKLGQGQDDSEVVLTSRASGAERPPPKDMVLRLWKDGFSIDDGPLRDYHDTGNKDFLDSVMRGEIPRELIRESVGAEVSLSMENHQHQEFPALKKKLQAFTGEGHRLGCPSPSLTMPSSSASVQDSASSEEKANTELKVDESQPTTNVQVRLADGSRLVVKVNLTHTVGDIRRYISRAKPQFSGVVFALMTTFPNKELEDEVNIKDGNLMNALIIQRLK